MRNLMKVLLPILLIVFIGCEDSITPYGDLREKTILNCILNDEDTTQTATVTTSYMGELNDPQTGSGDNVLSGTEITIAYGSSAKIMNQITGHPNRPSVYYSCDSIQIIPGQEYFINALLPDGRRLTSSTKAPELVTFQTTSDSLIPPVGKNWVAVYWSVPENKQYVSSVFKVYYFKNENGVDVRYEKKIPLKYTQEGGEYIPYFPAPTYSSMIYVEMDSFTRALEEISEGDPNKENYKILAFILEVRIYDKNLTSYYASQVDIESDFTVRVDEPDFSNIDGGYGIFACYVKQRMSIKFTHEYIESFGYVPALTEN